MTRVLGRLWLVLGVLVVALLSGGWWWAHPDVLDESYGAAMRADAVPLEPDSVFSAELTPPGHFPSEGTLTLRSVEVHLGRSAGEGAEVEVLRCTELRTDDGGHLSVGFGHELPPASHQCVPAEAGTVVTADDQLVALLRPSAAGRYRISGMTVGYRLDRSHLWRTGTETMRTSVSIGYRD